MCCFDEFCCPLRVAVKYRICNLAGEASMNRNDDLYCVESEKSAVQFAADFAGIVEKNVLLLPILEPWI